MGDTNKKANFRAAKKVKNKKKIVLGVLIMIVLCFGGIWYISNMDNHELDKDAVMATSDRLSKEEIKKELKNKADQDVFVVSMSKNPVFKTGNSEGKVNIEIGPRNYYTVRVEIALDRDETMIYKSGNIEPGYMIKKTKLDTVMKKGKYDCTATFIALDQNNDYKEVKRASTKIQIEITK